MAYFSIFRHSAKVICWDTKMSLLRHPTRRSGHSSITIAGGGRWRAWCRAGATGQASLKHKALWDLAYPSHYGSYMFDVSGWECQPNTGKHHSRVMCWNLPCKSMSFTAKAGRWTQGWNGWSTWKPNKNVICLVDWLPVIVQAIQLMVAPWATSCSPKSSR